MTYEELGERIAKMTPEQRKKVALVAIEETGLTEAVEDLISEEAYNGGKTPDQFVIMPSVFYPQY